jgi:HB1, ASXL, restriction endonuclease HTH domain
MSAKKSPKTKTTKAPKAKKTKQPKDKKLSAIDAAAQVLASAKEPMNAKELIEAMATKALWTSPGGKTPHATLFSAIIREISVKGKESRFVKAGRGKFAAK